MKIVIATGIFEPEAGGPATYAPRIARMLAENGWDVTVVTYSDEEKYDFDAQYKFKLVRVVRRGRILNRWRFFRCLLRVSRDADLIYTLDWFAAGLPMAITSALLAIPYLARVGGDYVWEQKYCEKVREPLPLRDFYERGVYRRGMYRVYYEVVRYVLRRARHVVFNSEEQRDLYGRFFALPLQHTSVISNAVPVKEFSSIRRTHATHEIVFWGRFNGMKNVSLLVRAFATASLPSSYRLILIGDGPQKENIVRLVRDFRLEHRVEFLPRMRQEQVLERVKNARLFVLPSWTDISPNQVYEAMAVKLPFIITSENFLPIRKELPLMVDPREPDELIRALEVLVDDSAYKALSDACAQISTTHGWADVLSEHLAVFKHYFGIGAVNVLQIGADRSKRGILHEHTHASSRQMAYGAHFDSLDIIGFSLARDKRHPFELSKTTHVYPTDSRARFLYGLDALEIARPLVPTVVSTQDPFETGLVGYLISRIKGVPLHVQVHTDFLSPQYSSGFVNKMRMPIARFILRRADRIRVVSERVRESIMLEISPRVPITVLPIFVDVAHFAHAPLDRELSQRFSHFMRKVLIVSRLEPEKNIGLALRAFAAASAHDACLIIVGSGSERAMLDRLVRQLRIGDRVFFENTHDVAAYYRLADLVLVPSHYEGYGLVIVEALAAGKPVISTDVGVARQAGAIVAPPERFTEALAAWFRSGSRAGRLFEYPYANFDEYVRAYCDDIRRCVETKKSP